LKTDTAVPAVLNPLILCAKRYRKAKFHTRTGQEGPEGEHRYSYTLSLTSVIDGCRWSTPSPRKRDPAPIVNKAEWDPGTKILAPTGI